MTSRGSVSGTTTHPFEVLAHLTSVILGLIQLVVALTPVIDHSFDLS